MLARDNAGWRRARDLAAPDGIHIEHQPPYSPELQPAERLWPLTNEAVANRSFASLDDLGGVIEQRCLQLSDQPDTIRHHTHFNWWPNNL